MRRPFCRHGRSALPLLSILIFAFLSLPCSAPLHAADTRRDLQLDVIINGLPAHMIGSFVQRPDGAIGATPDELASLGLLTGGAAVTGGLVMLHEIPGLKYAYEERMQRISITVDPALLRPHVFDLRPAGAGSPTPRAGWGTVLNYDLFSSMQGSQPLALNGSTLTLDGRAFSPYGTIEQSEIVTAGVSGTPAVVRLDSFYRYSDPNRLVSFTAGDAVSGGLAWSRPIRIGGLQAQRNFALRPDLVTMPLPNLGGTAAVPSTVDVFVNNTRLFSQDVGAGPFSLTNIPLVTGAGNAQIVVRDSSGRETLTDLPFYGSADLLAPGLSSWSVEAGLPRVSYGSGADSYLADPVASATWRLGMLDWLTAETHGEVGGGVVEGGVGAAIRTGALGVATASIAASTTGSGRGLQSAVSWQTSLRGISVNIGTQRTVADYEDLASATARRTARFAPFDASSSATAAAVGATVSGTPIYANARPPAAVDHITIGGPVAFDPAASWNVSFVHLREASNTVSNLLSVSISHPLPWNAALFATAFRDFGTGGGTGVLVGLSIPLGQSVSVSSSVSGGATGAVPEVEASHALGSEPGSVGWRIRDQEGPMPYREALVSYRAPFVTVEAGANQGRSGAGGTLDISGAIALMAGSVFFSDRIDDAFAVVDTGAPNVAVANENRPIGTSDSRGLLLVPTLRSYQGNKISIDPSNLPVDAELATTRDVVTPADRAGVLVSFKVHSDSTAALVTFVRPDRRFVPAGSSGRLEGADHADPFIVGYDGQAFIKGLGASNRVTIEDRDGTCHAAFPFTPRPGEQVHIGPVTCQ